MCVLLQMALHLNLADVLAEVVNAVPAKDIDVVAASVPTPFLQRCVVWSI